MHSIFLRILNTLLVAFTISTDDFFLSFTYALSNPEIDKRKSVIIARIFGGLQFLAVIIGWLVTNIIGLIFHPFLKIVPYILLIFLVGIGIKLLIEGVYLRKHSFNRIYDFSLKGIFIHGLTSSIDALSLGMTFVGKPVHSVIGLSVAVALMTYFRALSGIKFGKKLNSKMPFAAGIISGIILILVGIEIFYSFISMS